MLDHIIHDSCTASGVLERGIGFIARSSELLGVRVDDIAAVDLISSIRDAVITGGRLTVVNANAHLINLAHDHDWISELFAKASICFCDGAGVQFALWLQTGTRPQRHTPPQWIEPLAEQLAPLGASAFWLGGMPGVAEAAARNLQHCTGLRSAGSHHGFFDMTAGSPGNEAVLAAIRDAQPDLLLLNMGMPLQERWLYDNWDRIDVPVVVTAGALVDHVAGRVSRPPAWVANCGLEWLVRLAVEPRRLWKRYLLGLPVFTWRVLRDTGVRRLFRRRAVPLVLAPGTSADVER